MPCDPSRQVFLILFGKLHDQPGAVDRLPKLFQALVRLPRGRLVGEHHRAVVRDIRQNFRNFIPVGLAQLEQIHLVHLNHGMLRHHGQVFHGVGEGLQIEGLAVHPVEIEGFRQRVQQLLFHLLQVVVQQKDFFPMENVQPPQVFAFQLGFQLL